MSSIFKTLCWVIALGLIISAQADSRYTVNGSSLTDMSIEELYALEDELVSALNDVFVLNSTESSGEVTGVYVVNQKTKKFHFPYCYSALQIGQDRRFELCAPSELLEKGYSPCGQCKPCIDPDK